MKEKRFSNDYMEVNLKDIKAHIKKKLPCGLIIDGGFGEGKTGVADAIGSYYESLYNCEFEPHNQIGMGGKKFVEVFDWCKKNNKHVCIYDEASDYGRSGSISKFNNLITTMLSKTRSSEILIIFIIYSVRKLDQSMLEAGFIQGLIHCYGKVQGKYTQVKVYDADSVYFLIGRMTQLKKWNINPNKAYNEKQVNYSFSSLVYPPSKEHQMLIDKMSNADKKADIESTAMALNGYISLNELINKVGLSNPTVLTWIKKLNIVAKKVGKRNYYPIKCVDLIVNRQKN